MTRIAFMCCFAAAVIVLLLAHKSDAIPCYKLAKCFGVILDVDGSANRCCKQGGGSYMKKGKCKTCAGVTPPPFLWSEWTKWKTCCYEKGYDSRYKEKKQGHKTRFRDCILGSCPGKKSVRETVSKCEPPPGNEGLTFCPVKGSWSAWSEWGRCDAYYTKCSSDGNKALNQKGVYGLKNQTRRCDNPAPKHGGAHCEGSDLETTACVVGHCPVNGGFCEWSEWSTCTKSCTTYGAPPDGTHRRKRLCECPIPEHGGKYCEGSHKENGVCGDKVYCPLDGTWNEWTDWSECDRECGIGEQWRHRTCNRPLFGGRLCQGLSREYVLCQKKECPSICDMESSGYSGSASGYGYSGSGEPDYDVCCPPLKVYVKTDRDCCRENISLSSGSGLEGPDGNENPTNAIVSSAGSADGSVSSYGSGSGSTSGDSGLYYDCEPMGSSSSETADPSGSGSGNEESLPTAASKGTEAPIGFESASGSEPRQVKVRKVRSGRKAPNRRRRLSKHRDDTYRDME